MVRYKGYQITKIGKRFCVRSKADPSRYIPFLSYDMCKFAIQTFISRGYERNDYCFIYKGR